MKIIKYLGIIILLMALAAPADAKWWIFGKSEDEVATKYLYLDNISFDEISGKATLYKEALVNGMVTIKGKATSGKSKIVAAEVTIDGKATWKDAQLNPDTGDFIYTFTPELNKLYSVYVKMIDTAGKSNKIEDTFREFIVTDQRIAEIAREALNRLISAYQNKSRNQFMAYVSDDFAGDASTLDRAISKDFSFFDNIKISYTINNITAAGGKVFIGITYNRSVYSLKGNRTLTDNGWTEFVFEVKEQKPKLFSMKNPLMFGLSDASNVATGNSSNTANTPVLVVDERGNASTPAYSSAIQSIQNASAVVQNTITLRSFSPTSGEGVVFETGEIVVANPNNLTNADIAVRSHNGRWEVQNGTGIIILGQGTIANLNEVPASGYCYTNCPNNAVNMFALRLPNGKYGVIEEISLTGADPNWTRRFKYKYQPNGTPNF